MASFAPSFTHSGLGLFQSANVGIIRSRDREFVDELGYKFKDNYKQSRAESTVTLNSLFFELYLTWEEDSKTSSFAMDMVARESFQRILALGPEAIPLILRVLASRPSFLFLALKPLTGVDPVLPSHQGTIELMISDWMNWAKEHAII